MPARRRLLSYWLIVAAAAALLALHAYWYRAYVSDDAYISLRYARRLLDGQGLTFTDGERVEGYSNLAWVLACALLGKLGVDLVAAARLLGAAGMGAALVLLGRAQRANGLPAVAAASFAFAAAGPIAVWTVGGLEAPFEAAFLTWGVACALALIDEPHATTTRTLRAGLPLAALALTRPDGLVLIGALALAVAWSHWSIVRALVLALPAALATVGQLGFRLAYYHAWLPNTAWAKLRPGAATLRSGLAYLGDGALGLSGLAVLGVLGLALAPRRRAAVLGAPLLAWLAYVALVGGDFMPAHRHLVPAVVLLCFAAGEAAASARRFGRDGHIRLALISVASLLWFGVAQFYDPENLFAHAQLWARDGLRLGELFRRGLGARRPLVALDAAGSIAYASGLPTLDMLGLCDAYLAHHPPKSRGRDLPGHALGDGDYVLGRAPDLIVFRGPEGGEPMFTGGMQMRADPRFAEYERVTFADGELRSRVFVRRHGRAGIEGARVPGWLFANAPGNLARLDGAGRLEGQLTAPATLAIGDAPARIEVDPPDAAVTIELGAGGELTVRPTGTAHLRALVLRR